MDRKVHLARHQGLLGCSVFATKEETRVSRTGVHVTVVGSLDLTLDLRLDDMKIVIGNLLGALMSESMGAGTCSHSVLGWKGDNNAIGSAFERADPAGHFVCLKAGISSELRRVKL